MFQPVESDRAALRTAFVTLKRGWLPGAALACSGGHDSTALLLVAARARDKGVIGDFMALHVDHGLRPDSADAEFVERLCAQFGVPCARSELAWPQSRHVGEDELRARRYATLAAVTQRLGLCGVVTAHTRDDQVETVLMRLLTGAGPLAAAGMRVDSTLPTSAGALRLRRPWLGVSRAELAAVLRNQQVVPRLDPTNADRRYRRNALRADVIPALQAAYPGFEDALLRAVELAARDAQFADECAADALGARDSDSDIVIVRRDAQTARIDVRWLRSAPAALATRVLRAALEPLTRDSARRDITFERLEALRLAAAGRVGARIELPGDVVASVEHDTLLLERRAQREEDEGA